MHPILLLCALSVFADARPSPVSSSLEAREDGELAARIDLCPDFICGDDDDDKPPKLPNQMEKADESDLYAGAGWPRIRAKGDSKVKAWQTPEKKGSVIDDMPGLWSLDPKDVNNTAGVSCKVESSKNEVWYSNSHGYFPKKKVKPDSDKDAGLLEQGKVPDCLFGAVITPFKGDPKENKSGDAVAIGGPAGKCLDVTAWTEKDIVLRDVQLANPIEYAVHYASHCTYYSKKGDDKCGTSLGMRTIMYPNSPLSDLAGVTGIACY